MKTKKSYFSKALVLLMAVMMVFTMMPTGMWGGAETAWAAEGEASAGTQVTVTVNVVPATATVTFTDESGNPISEVRDNNTVGSYHQYEITTTVNSKISYTGKDGEINLGGDQFVVTDENRTVVLVRDNARYNGKALTNEGDYTFTIKNAETEIRYGEAYLDSGYRYTPTLLVAGVAYTGKVSLAEKTQEDYYLKNEGSFAIKIGTNYTSPQTCNLPIDSYKVLKVTAPREAVVKIYRQESYFVVTDRTSEATTSVNEEDNTKTYVLKGTTAHTNYQYRASMNEKVTEAGYLTDGKPVTVTFSEKNPTETTTVSENVSYDDNSIVLNIDDSKDTNELAMGVGDTFKLRAWRAAWQIINTQTNNQMIEPDMHYQILSGDDVIDITPTNESENGENYCSGNAKNNWLNVTAKQKGTAVVAVWYDAINIGGETAIGGFFGATDKARYGVFVVNVGEDTTVKWNPVSSDGDWDSEFDTVYYTGNEGIFTIKPDDVKAITVQNVYGTTLGKAATVTASSDGAYNVPVTSGANIITATTENGEKDYFVVRAKQISYTIKNNTQGTEATNAAPAIATGDSVTITLNGLNMPVPKMSGIYNPGYLGTAKLCYTLNDSANILSEGTQYDFTTSPKGNSITFTAYKPGNNALEGYINLTSMGDDFGNHRNTTDNGRAVNQTASEKFGQFGILPSINFDVTGDEKTPTEEELTTLSSVSILGGLSSYVNSFKFTGAANATTNWGTRAVSANDTLQVKVTAKSYMSKLTLKYWNEGEDAKTVELVSGVTSAIKTPGFDTTKAFYMELTAGAGDVTKTYTYAVYPKNYANPFIESITFTNENNEVHKLSTALDTTLLKYNLPIGEKTQKLNLAATIPTNDTQTKSDKITIGLYKGTTLIGDEITVSDGTAANTKWEKKDLELGEADCIKIQTTSYVDDKYSKTYTINFIRVAPDKTVTVTISDAGDLKLAQKEITVSDTNRDGKVDVDEVLKKAHDISYPGGADAGYSSYNHTQYGLSLGKLWGNDSGAFGYYLNNKSCNGLADDVPDNSYLVAYIYHDKNTWTDKYAFFDSQAYTTTEGTQLKLTLKTDVWGTVSNEKGSNIELYNSALEKVAPIYGNKNNYAAKDNGDGTYSLTVNSAGKYYVVASKEDKSIVPAVAALTVNEKTPTTPEQPSKPSENDTVTIRLIGATKATKDVDFSKNICDSEYVTWIPTKSYSLASDQIKTVEDLLSKALEDANISAIGVESGYVSTITAPSSLGGYALSEFTNGSYSGWMYTVNGSHPNLGLDEYNLKAGDKVIWHYVNDYRYEVADWFEGSSGNSSQQNLWLKAADRLGASGGSANAPVEEIKDVTSDTKTGTTTAPTEVKVTEKTNADGTKEKVAEVKISADNQKEILKQAKVNKSKEIILNVSKTAVGDAAKAEVTLDKSFIDAIVKDTDAKLTVKTPFGDKTYTQEELKEMSAAATGNTVSLEVAKAAEEPADDTAAAEKIAKAKSITSSMKLTARSSKTAKKNVKAILKADKATSAAINELKDLGYTVKYRFYRSTKKSAGYKSTVTKKTATYTNTSGKTGTKYFYKVQVRVYDEKGKLVAKTALKQCKYACRTWSR